MYSAVFVKSEVSNPFNGELIHDTYVFLALSLIGAVVTMKDFRGQMESTALSRSFSDQGVRLRLRKESRTIAGYLALLLSDVYGED